MSRIAPVQRLASIERGSSLLEIMANAKRLHVLTVLSDGETSVKSLGEIVGLSQSALSQHLAKFRKAGLVTTRRDAQSIYYSCTSDAVSQILKLLETIFHDGEDGETAERKRA